MRLTDVIKYGNQIVEGQEQLFIASEDLLFRGLPILKDALIFNNGKRLSVNILEAFALDSSHQDLYGLKGVLPKEENMYFIIDKNSSCMEEETKLLVSSIGYWHTNHFDKVESITKYLNSRIQNNEPELDYNGIKFSSTYYVFDIENEILIEFINTTSMDIPMGDIVITLPKLLNIHREKASYTLVPITGMEYQEVYFAAGEGLTLNSNGVLEGNTGKGFKAEARNLANNNITTIDLPSHKYINISPEGLLTTTLFDKESQNRINFQLRKI